MALLEIKDLHTEFRTPAGVARAVNGVSMSLDRGETLAVVGESGCGKSVTAFSVMRLIQDPPGRITGGKIIFDGTDLLTLGAADMRRIRGDRISMIFQEPMTSLNPVFTIGDQIAEAVLLHRGVGRAAAWARAVELLDLVRIPEAKRRASDYPHRLSGGMRQRAMIAMALACEPDLLIADEPTTALDVTIQAQIMELIRSLQAELGMAIMLITHDLGVVAEAAQRVVVMYAGRKVEEAPVEALFADPRHPYTKGLLASLPHRAFSDSDTGAPRRLQEIPGMVPSLFDMPKGCAYAPRCPLAMERCRTDQPALSAVGDGRLVACFAEEALAGRHE